MSVVNVPRPKEMTKTGWGGEKTPLRIGVDLFADGLTWMHIYSYPEANPERWVTIWRGYLSELPLVLEGIRDRGYQMHQEDLREFLGVSGR